MKSLLDWLGPILVVVALPVAGGFVSGAAGVVGGLLAAIGVVGAVAAGAAVWSAQVGSLLHPEDAAEVAPHPPGFRGLTSAVYRRTLR